MITELVSHLRSAVANIIETKRGGEYIYIPTLIKYLAHDDVEGLEQDELVDLVLKRDATIASSTARPQSRKRPGSG